MVVGLADTEERDDREDDGLKRCGDAEDWAHVGLLAWAGADWKYDWLMVDEERGLAGGDEVCVADVYVPKTVA